MQELFNYNNESYEKTEEKNETKNEKILYISDNILESHKDDGGATERFLVDEDDSYCVFSQREVKEIEWIWKPYIVRGNLNVIVGEGGVGKSYFTTWLLSAISRGDRIPFTGHSFIIGDSILQNAEDDIDATILPRLFANNANIDKIGFFSEESKTFSIKQLYRLENILYKVRPSILVLDPIQAYIGDINMNSSVEVRNALNHLKYSQSIITVR